MARLSSELAGCLLGRLRSCAETRCLAPARGVGSELTTLGVSAESVFGVLFCNGRTQLQRHMAKVGNRGGLSCTDRLFCMISGMCARDSQQWSQNMDTSRNGLWTGAAACDSKPCRQQQIQSAGMKRAAFFPSRFIATTRSIAIFSPRALSQGMATAPAAARGPGGARRRGSRPSRCLRCLPANHPPPSHGPGARTQPNLEMARAR